VTTQSGCAWTALSNGSWLVVTSNSTVTGNGTVNYSALSNSSTSTRTATLTVAGQSVTITQNGTASYTITASARSNGSISPQGNVMVNSGSSQTFTIKPNQYYKVYNVKVDGVSKGSITSYTFQNVTSNHSISATFVKKGSR
jgi:antitoxin (DNA-binding transcriptional repressor) of toxin-antitoxin stability system